MMSYSASARIEVVRKQLRELALQLDEIKSELLSIVEEE